MAEAKRDLRNPLIGSVPGDTVDHVCDVLAYMQVMEVSQAEIGDHLGASPKAGRTLLLECVRHAVSSLNK